MNYLLIFVFSLAKWGGNLKDEIFPNLNTSAAEQVDFWDHVLGLIFKKPHINGNQILPCPVFYFDFWSLQFNKKLVVLRDSIKYMSEVHATFLVQLFIYAVNMEKLASAVRGK